MRGSFLKKTGSPGKQEPGDVFHRFFFQQDPDSGKYFKLRLTESQQKLFQEIIAQGPAEISEEKYWRSFGRFMITHAPKGYIAWERRTYWLVLLPPVALDHK